MGRIFLFDRMHCLRSEGNSQDLLIYLGVANTRNRYANSELPPQDKKAAWVTRLCCAIKALNKLNGGVRLKWLYDGAERSTVSTSPECLHMKSWQCCLVPAANVCFAENSFEKQLVAAQKTVSKIRFEHPFQAGVGSSFAILRRF